MSTILQLAPQNVWKHFYSLTQIPRPSGHMEKITEFLINFGKGLGLESFVDEVGNVIIRHFCYFLSRMRAKDAWQAICVPVHHTISGISKPTRQNPPQALPHPAETA